MDSCLLHSLGKSLYFLQRVSETLDDLLIPRQGCSETSGITGKARGSRPPVNLSMLDLKAGVESVLWFWSLQLTAEKEISPPASRAIANTTEWLLTYIGYLDDVEWARVAAEEILAEVELVRAVVDPDDVLTEMPEWATAREAVRWLKLRGVGCSRSQLMRWAADGVIESVIADDGRHLLRLDSVLSVADRRRFDDRLPVNHPVM